MDKGRSKQEKSLIKIENGCLIGIGYVPFNFKRIPIKKWDGFLDIYTDNKDARAILKQYLRKSDYSELINIMDL